MGEKGIEVVNVKRKKNTGKAKRLWMTQMPLFSVPSMMRNKYRKKE